MTTRKEILKQATDAVCTDREGQYGSPEDNFRRIADLWTAYWGGYPFEPKDVAMMMSLLKIARIATGKHKDDNYIDLAGYAACGAELGSLETAHEADAESEPDEIEIAVYICADDDSESDKEYIKRLSQTVSNLTEELEKAKDEKSEVCSMWKKTYDEMVCHYKKEIDILKDNNRTLYNDKLKIFEKYHKANEEIKRLKKEIEPRDSIHNDQIDEVFKLLKKKDDEIRKLRSDLDKWKGGCEKFEIENNELKKIRDDLVTELLNEREAKETASIEMKKCQADRDYHLGKCIDFETRLEQALGKDVK
nr:MAG TPA: coiled-coil domain-containing protein [Caudoviricetes sp.]